MHLLYIDPGTGSMLFAVLIGVIGALGYALSGLFIKLRFKLSGGSKKDESSDIIPLVIFSDDKIYWNTFEPICDELEKRKFNTVYMTSSDDDPALEKNYEYIKTEFIGEGNRAFAKLNFLKAKVLFATTPGLDVYQWKRSKSVMHYVHIPHVAKDITLYRMFGIDYFDTILLSSDYQIKQVRQLEELRNLPEKEVVKVGIPYMDSILERIEDSNIKKNDIPTVLLAPSWGESSLLNVYNERIINALIDTGYKIIIRPHPQSYVSETQLMDDLMKKFPASDMLEWNRDADNFDVLNRSDILISDFSGVMFDFSIAFDKPILYANSEFDNSIYDAWWLDEPLWIFEALPRIGTELKPEHLDNLKALIDDCLNNFEYSQNREEVRNEIWEHIGEGAARTADYLINKVNELEKAED